MRQKYFISIITIILSVFLSYIASLTNREISKQSIETKTNQNIVIIDNKDYKLFDVIRITDGDTILIDYNGTNEKIRLIGVNTPETVDPRKIVECFGEEASKYTKLLLENRSVKIEFDESQGKRDKYGRLLAYVFRDDGLFINKNLIDMGYGYEYTYKYPYKYQNEFKGSQKNASLRKLGLWADEVCKK